jgi:hypothetical protein
LPYLFLDPYISQNLKQRYFLKKYRKNVGQLTKNLSFLTQKFVTDFSEVWVGDPRNEIRYPEKLIPDPDPEVKKAAPEPGFRSSTMLKI